MDPKIAVTGTMRAHPIPLIEIAINSFEKERLFMI